MTSMSLDRNILSMHPMRKHIAPIVHIKIPIVPEPEVFPDELDVIWANENLLISGFMINSFFLYIMKKRSVNS